MREASKKGLKKKSDITVRGRTNKSAATKKYAVTKKSANDKQKKEKLIYSNEIFGIALAAVGILILLSFTITSTVGLFGEFIKKVLTGLLGVTSYFIAPVIIIYSVLMIFKNIGKKSAALIFSLILLLLIASMIHTGYYSEEEYINLSFINTISKFFNDGTQLRGGGFFGGIVSLPLILLFKTTGTIIILTSLSIIDIILLTNVSLTQFFKKLWGGIKNGWRKLMSDEDEKENEIEYVENLPPLETDYTDYSTEEKKQGHGFDVIDFESERRKKEFLKKHDIQVTGSGTDRFAEKPENPTKTDAAPATAVRLEKEKSHEMYYRYPTYDLLEGKDRSDVDSKATRTEVMEGARKLEDTLNSFGVSARVINISRGPSITRYELQPSSGVKVSRIVNLADDIALNMACSEVRIEAPIPGKAAIGIEIPNKEIKPVRLREVLESEEFRKLQTKLPFALGIDISGTSVIADISKMPHLLIAGATGSGKSVSLNSLIISLIYKASPDEVKLLLIDPKMVELREYNGIPHLLIPVVTDPKKAAGALSWAVQEMVNRYKLFADKGARDLKGYNSIVSTEEGGETLPQIVIIIDELSDMMMVAPNEVEDSICRLAQMARAAGMYLVIATQRPSVDVITGVIKANIPSRISFAVSSQVDSRTILDMSGAEKLMGKGDMLYYPVGASKPLRLQGALVTEKEVRNVVEFVKSHGAAEYDEDIIEDLDSEHNTKDAESNAADELLPQAIELVVNAGQASVSFLQRKFRVGYARAARIVDQMEERGIVGRFEGSKPRQVLITKEQWLEMK
ncbi:MAG: DNA translocase FtsK [Eubacteriales bacterium]|nr:DNA translocase FtsK [Eubacteriales bacterium]